MRKNIVEPDTPQTTKWRLRIPWGIPKTKDIHSENVIFLLFNCNSGYTNVPKYYVYRSVPCPVHLLVSLDRIMILRGKAILSRAKN